MHPAVGCQELLCPAFGFPKARQSHCTSHFAAALYGGGAITKTQEDNFLVVCWCGVVLVQCAASCGVAACCVRSRGGLADVQRGLVAVCLVPRMNTQRGADGGTVSGVVEHDARPRHPLYDEVLGWVGPAGRPCGGAGSWLPVGAQASTEGGTAVLSGTPTRHAGDMIVMAGCLVCRGSTGSCARPTPRYEHRGPIVWRRVVFVGPACLPLLPSLPIAVTRLWPKPSWPKPSWPVAWTWEWCGWWFEDRYVRYA